MYFTVYWSHHNTTENSQLNFELCFLQYICVYIPIDMLIEHELLVSLQNKQARGAFYCEHLTHDRTCSLAQTIHKYTRVQEILLPFPTQWTQDCRCFAIKTMRKRLKHLYIYIFLALQLSAFGKGLLFLHLWNLCIDTEKINYHFAFTVSILMQILLQIRWEINKATDLQSAYGVFYSVLIILWIYFPAVPYCFSPHSQGEGTPTDRFTSCFWCCLDWL